MVSKLITDLIATALALRATLAAILDSVGSISCETIARPWTS
jgi:hypothetical protein